MRKIAPNVLYKLNAKENIRLTHTGGRGGGYERRIKHKDSKGDENRR